MFGEREKSSKFFLTEKNQKKKNKKNFSLEENFCVKRFLFLRKISENIRKNNKIRIFFKTILNHEKFFCDETSKT